LKFSLQLKDTPHRCRKQIESAAIGRDCQLRLESRENNGARKLSQFEDNLHCLKWSLNAKQLAQLDEASRIELGFPTDFLRLKGVHEFLHGGTFELIERRVW
jgi:hypothetical protein